VRSQENGAVSKVNKKFISHLTRAQRTPSAAATVQVTPALPAVGKAAVLLGAHSKPFPAVTPSCKLAPWLRSKQEKTIASSAQETWTVATADGVRCARVR
jgi:hypothetical protein